MLQWDAVVGIMRDAQRTGDRLTVTLSGGAGIIRGYVVYKTFITDQIILVSDRKATNTHYIDVAEVAAITVTPS